jgi:predicted oxidoreductase (fatty acid repression mutant protein)
MKTAHWPLLWTFILVFPLTYYLYSSFTMGSVAEFKNPATTTLLELVKSRRTYYGLKAESPISDDAIDRIVQDSVLHVPSSFNTQTSRVVLLLKEEHKKVWDITIKVMEGLVAAGHVPKEMYETSTLPKLEAFKAAYGTVSSFPTLSIVNET